MKNNAKEENFGQQWDKISDYFSNFPTDGIKAEFISKFPKPQTGVKVVNVCLIQMNRSVCKMNLTVAYFQAN